MHTFRNPKISIATTADALLITNLLNISYRGEASKQGWTTEAELIAGDTRANENMIIETMQKAGSVFLKYTDDGNQLIGCVNLQQQDQKIYLGMFSVLPQAQGAGIGKQILIAAEAYALQQHCSLIYMSVISLRTELIDWYIRFGYEDTGKRIPFVADGITGRHLRKLEFAILEKNLTSIK